MLDLFEHFADLLLFEQPLVISVQLPLFAIVGADEVHLAQREQIGPIKRFVEFCFVQVDHDSHIVIERYILRHHLNLAVEGGIALLIHQLKDARQHVKPLEFAEKEAQERMEGALELHGELLQSIVRVLILEVPDERDASRIDLAQNEGIDVEKL